MVKELRWVTIIDARGHYVTELQYKEIEGYTKGGAPVMSHWKNVPREVHDQREELEMDK